MIRIQTLRVELRPTIRLALPLVLAELGWMSMAIVDTMMVGRLPNSATAMGAVSLGSNIFIVLGLFGGGLLLGLDTLVAQAFGAGQREDCHRSLLNGIYLSIALTPLLAAPVWLLPRLLSSMQVDPAIVALAVPYTNALTGGVCLDQRESGERLRQLDLDLRKMGRAGDGRGWLGLVDGHRPHLYGGSL